MDFSSSTRALNSLLRRQPSINNPEILSIAQSILRNNEIKFELEEYPLEILRLISFGINDRWEALAVGLHLSIEYLSNIVEQQSEEASRLQIYPEGPRVPETTSESKDTSSSNTQTHSFEIQNITIVVSFCQTLTDTCIAQLEHSEPRVRTLIAKAVAAHGSLCSVYSNVYPELSVQRNKVYERITSSLLALLRSGREQCSLKSASDGSEVALDDTTGWKSLETSLHALAAYLDTPSVAISSASPEHRAQILDLIKSLNHCATKHINRHVRAASLQALERFVTKGCLPEQLLESNLQTQLIDILSITLADNWSQVRMAACTLCRTLFQTLKSSDLPMTSYFPKILPRMCLNRFYLAQGVKLYSQETWRMVFGSDGVQRVVENISGIVRYYVQCCDADNHVVREAACQAVAELAQKVGTRPEYAPFLEPFFPMLLQALLVCFHDESWPVRDQACTACGIFAKCYPELTLPELPTLWDRWSSQLTDQIWSVREGAAVALGDAITAFGEEFQDRVIAFVKELLPGAKEEKAMSKEEYDKRQNDYELHSNSQLYSCGSLAPKLRKGGCSDCFVTRPKALWERTDGCIYMLREICVKNGSGELSIKDEVLHPLMVELADVARVNHFPLAEDLRCTLWKCLPDIARGLGKKRFKSKYLNLFLDLLMRNLERGSANSEYAAEMCVKELYGVVGKGIFVGRVKDVVGDEWVQVLEKIDYGRKGYGNTIMETSVSPFGPPVITNETSLTNTNTNVWGGEESF